MPSVVSTLRMKSQAEWPFRSTRERVLRGTPWWTPVPCPFTGLFLDLGFQARPFAVCSSERGWHPRERVGAPYRAGHGHQGPWLPGLAPPARCSSSTCTFCWYSKWYTLLMPVLGIFRKPSIFCFIASPSFAKPTRTLL